MVIATISSISNNLIMCVEHKTATDVRRYASVSWYIKHSNTAMNNTYNK